MEWFIDVWSKYSPFFVRYVLPFAGVGIIVYVIYLIKYLFNGGN